MEVPELEKLYAERSRLYENAISLTQEGRVCVAPQIMYLPIFLYSQTTVRAAMEDYRNLIPSWLRYHEEFQPDLYWAPGPLMPLKPMETLGCRYVRWPGKHLGDNEPFQVLDQEFMSADEYVEYAEDPTGFMLRKILPRHYEALDGLKMVDLSNAISTGAFFSMIPLSFPPVRHALDAMSKAGGETLEYAKAMGEMGGMFAAKGWPSALDMVANVPFDVFNDLFRGLINTTMDMLECPDELLMAIEATTKIQVRSIKEQMRANPHNRYVYFFLHNGTDLFMSPKQFEEFYWPGLKACINAVIEMDGVPCIYTEGKMELKLDYLADVPKGKVLYHLVDTDLKLAKQKLGGIACLSGCVDGSVLKHGTPEQVERQVREVLDIAMVDGGYMLDTTIPLDVVDPRNLHTLFDTVHKYGNY